MSRLCKTTPRADGFRMPGEFEKKAGCWLGWPSRSDVWRNGGKPVQKVWVELATAIATSERVTVAVDHDQFNNARGMLPDNIRVVELSANDAWFRDMGALFLVNNQTKEVRGLDWGFNAWGGLDEGLYFPWDKDDMAAAKMCEIEWIDRYRGPMVTEGGGLQCDGQGTLLTTESVILNPNRNPGMTKGEAEQIFSDYMGIDKVLWLPRGCKFDETDGHIDDLACFVAPAELLLSWTDDENDPQYEVYAEAFEILSQATDARGRRLTIHKIHQPAPAVWSQAEAEQVDVTADATQRLAGYKVMGSYINYYVGNSVVVVPEFDDPHDQPAQELLGRLFPDKRVIGLKNAREILLGGGNIACVTQPQYAAE